MNKNFADRLILDELNLKTLVENKQKLGAFTLFKNTFLGQLWNMVKANWLTLAFCIPVVAWIVISALAQTTIDSKVGYSGNMGIGYSPNDYAYEQGMQIDFSLAMQRALIMWPMVIIAFLGLAGTFNVIKYNAWGMQVKILKTFLKGVKNSFAPFVFMGFLLGGCYVLMIYSSHIFDVYSLNIGLKITAFIFLSVLTLLIATLSMYVFPQAVMFDLSVWAMLKNAVILSTKFIVQSLLITVIGALSIGLLFLKFHDVIEMIAMMVFFMAAFSYAACVWTLYNHHVFEVISEIKKENGVVAHNDNTPTSPHQKKKKTSPSYQNPKKKKRS